jgi:putative oxidoreductase
MGKVPPSSGFIERVGEMGFPAPVLFAWLSGLAEFGAGLLLAIGLATRPAALYVALNMCVVFFIAHGGDSFGQRERPFLFLAIFLFFALSGGGRYSVDRFARGRP